jgi:hypothetical protein
MATALFEFYQEQARRILTPAPSDNGEDGDIYKVAPEMLEPLDYDRKRHLQIPKAGFQIAWNALTESSELRCGYVARPLILPRVNLLQSSNWNYAIVRQLPGRYVTPMTPWVVDIRKISTPYLLRAYDGRPRNPAHTHFYEAKKR